MRLMYRQGYWLSEFIAEDTVIHLPNGDWVINPRIEQRLIRDTYGLVELYRLRPIPPKEPDDELRNAVGDIDRDNAAATSSEPGSPTGGEAAAP